MVRTDERQVALEAAASLARSLARSQEYRDLERAQEAVHQDQRARALLGSFQELQQEQQTLSWDDLGEGRRKRLQLMWQEMNEYSVTAEYFRAQDALIEMFREVNSTVSAALGFDYASTCAPGCCS